MSISSALIGVPILLKRRSLLSETLSHAAYPGVVFGVLCLAAIFPDWEKGLSFAVLIGAFLFALLGLLTVRALENRWKVPSDAALSFVLAVFFGAGILEASVLQARFPQWQKQVQILLFGQAATMSDLHIVIYGGMALCVIAFLYALFRPLQAWLFDRDFAATVHLPIRLLERLFAILFLFSLIISIRSVGVVLLSGMVIAPAVAARQFSDRLQITFLLAAVFGALSGFLGNVLSVLGSEVGHSLPTGPMIVLVGSSLALLSLLLAPKRGLLFRKARIFAFRFKTLRENILKGLWRRGKSSWLMLQKRHPVFSGALRSALWKLKKNGLVIEAHGLFELTATGQVQAAGIVRLHRLWELYLTQSLGVELNKVHHTAEEMEHILTPEIEKELTRILKNPKRDPHHQPIPEGK
jgi:manganese/zinc/iron transport system permease protein